MEDDRLISLKAAIDAVNSIDNLDAKARGGICIKLMGLPSAQPSFSQHHENDHSHDDAVSRKDCLECLQYKPSLKTKLKKRLKRRGEENEAD